MAKNPPSNTRDTGLIPGQGEEQLSLCSTIREAYAVQQKKAFKPQQKAHMPQQRPSVVKILKNKLIKNKQKTTMRHYVTPVRMAITKKSANNKCWRGYEEKETCLYCWWEGKLVRPLWRTV